MMLLLASAGTVEIMSSLIIIDEFFSGLKITNKQQSKLTAF